ncbi:hypothetical protein DZC72_13085 [Maribacter algicola]|uniref:Lipoprotein n=1 Tax=Maribacter algicola TaxID=2498892 RepID=A0A3R8Q2S9_9FLAO|nr:DUF6786 family protein [Maribacter algicola]RRQ48619.1 hypothetical protein DZC72_13085 [Maribacter algicola]
MTKLRSTILISKDSFFIFCLTVLLTGCQPKLKSGSFEADLDILKNINDIHVLQTENAMVAVSGNLQGRVFTSSSKGLKGKSYGWFKRKAILDGSFKIQFSGLGGEDRMWFGPQYGKYNVFFKKGSTFEDEHMRMAPDLDTLSFKVLSKSKKKVTSEGCMKIKNYQDFVFDIEVRRSVSIMEKKKIEENLAISLTENISYVGFETETKITNVGSEKWSKEKGLISIWILGCIIPTDNTVAIIPTRGRIEGVTNYFTPLYDSRMQIKDRVVYYKADANYLNKIGILPENTIPVFGSYSPEMNLLTIVEFTFDDSPLYMNSQKTEQIDPYGGDVINIFNDGTIATAGPFGPFYELESSSSAKELEVGAVQTHVSKTYHFEGDEVYLDAIAEAILGVKLSNRVIF